MARRSRPTRRRSPSEARRYEPGHTTRAGLGSAHQKEADKQRKALRRDPGQPCPYCQWPMYATPAEAMAAQLPYKLWRLELDDYPARVICRRTGQTPVKRLAHMFCNRSAGGKLGNAIKAATAAQPSRFDRW